MDHAEEIWGMIADGKTQQQVADEIGWGLSKVKQYSRLDQIFLIILKFVTGEATR